MIAKEDSFAIQPDKLGRSHGIVVRAQSQLLVGINHRIAEKARIHCTGPMELRPYQNIRTTWGARASVRSAHTMILCTHSEVHCDRSNRAPLDRGPGGLQLPRGIELLDAERNRHMVSQAIPDTSAQQQIVAHFDRRQL